MVDSQSDSNAFSVWIVSIDHYMAPPTHGLDISYSSFQGGKVNEVPVIRIYGSTPAGQKTCLHVHGIYLFNHTRNVDNSSKRERIMFVVVFSQTALRVLLYSYSSLRVCLLNALTKYSYYPHDVSCAANLLLIDCNLYGMGHMHLSKMQFCHPVPATFSPRKSDHISQHMDDDLHAN